MFARLRGVPADRVEKVWGSIIVSSGCKKRGGKGQSAMNYQIKGVVLTSNDVHFEDLFTRNIQRLL